MADRDFLDYYLGPTGIPDRLRALNELLNPYAESMRAAGLAMDERLTPESRREQAAYAASQAGIASLPFGGFARRAASTLRNMVRPDPNDVTAGRAIIRRDNEYRGEGPARISDTVAESDAPYAMRLTGMDQLEDMIASGLVRPKPGGYGSGNKSQLYFGETSSPDPMASLFTRPSEGKPVALVGEPRELAAYEGGIPIDALRHIFVRQENGELLDMLDDIIARNRMRR